MIRGLFRVSILTFRDLWHLMNSLNRFLGPRCLVMAASELQWVAF